jgi:hypothetical protein
MWDISILEEEEEDMNEGSDGEKIYDVMYPKFDLLCEWKPHDSRLPDAE